MSHVSMLEKGIAMRLITEQGGSFVIYRRGKEVARLVPPVKEEQDADLKQVRSSSREVRERISGKVSIRHLIEEGRRF